MGVAHDRPVPAPDGTDGTQREAALTVTDGRGKEFPPIGGTGIGGAGRVGRGLRRFGAGCGRAAGRGTRERPNVKTAAASPLSPRRAGPLFSRICLAEPTACADGRLPSSLPVHLPLSTGGKQGQCSRTWARDARVICRLCAIRFLCSGNGNRGAGWRCAQGRARIEGTGLASIGGKPGIVLPSFTAATTGDEIDRRTSSTLAFASNSRASARA